MIKVSLWCLFFSIAAIACAAELRAADQGLEARAVVTNQKFCLGMPTGLSLEQLPPDAITLRMQIQIFYRNTKSDPVILPLLEDPTIVLSRSLDDVKRQRNQSVIRFVPQKRPLDLADGGVDLDRPRDPYFSVILPGTESQWSLTEDAAIVVHNSTTKRPQTELLGRTVFIQLELGHLVIPDRLVQDLQSKWHNYGILWTGKVRTQPLEVAIPQFPTTAKCSSQFRVD